MSNVARLKKQAAEFEQKKQFDKALQKYMEVLQLLESHKDEIDVALYNRVGDLLIRQNNVGDAVTYYEKAVDLYAEGGLFNNAIALCNKILRQSPGCSEVYYKLGKISAQKGFISDAKANFLEYAGRKQKGGQIDEAFRALKEFADLCPDQDDIRLMLADQLVKAGRKDEALDQLNLLYQHLDAEGRGAEAEATIERMKAIDPSFEPQSKSGTKKKQAGGLVFLDLDEPIRAGSKRSSVESRRASRALDSLPILDATPSVPKAPPAPRAASSAPAAVEGISHGATVDSQRDATPEPLAGLESTSLDFQPTTAEGASDGRGSAVPMLDLELTSLEESSAASSISAGSALDTDAEDDEPSADLPMLDVDDVSRSSELPIVMPDEPASLPPHRDSGSMLSEMVPPLLQDAEESAESTMDVSGLDIDLGAEVPSSGMGTPGTGSPVVGESGGVPSLDLEPDGGSGFGPSGPLSSDAFDLEFDDASAVDELPVEAGSEADLDYGLVGSPAAELELEPLPDVEPEPELLPLPDPEPETVARRPSARSSTSILAQSVDSLRDAVASADTDWGLRRQFAEALLDAGDREGGLRELEAAMLGYERGDDLDSAGSVADEIIRLDPNSVRHHQKRVEYAFRTNDKPRLVEAYLQLADSLFRSGQEDKSRTVYQRVLDLAPDDIRAQAALTAFPEPEVAAPPKAKKEQERPPTTGIGRRYTAETKRSSLPPEPAAAAARPDDAFVNLGDWLRDDNGPKDTRMIVEEKDPSGDEEADFADMLKKFKQGIAENVEDEDHESHYDLGVAYKEMGLLDEAISEFQKALRGTLSRVRTYEALGDCFIAKGQHQVSTTVLSRALVEKGVTDDQLVGVLYLLGVANEALQKRPEALEYYNRVFAVDIQFRDVGERIMAVEQVAR